jgi:cytochrome oxidase Cu insertion factor (SCO1/SenC/PrrC family)
MKSLALVALLVAACHDAPPVPAAGAPAASVGSAAPPSVTAPATAPLRSASLGQAAPDFTLPDLDGRPTHLADLRGRVVVLEWFNPECPFVRLNHTSGPLKDMARRWAARGVVWLSVNSSAPGKQGYGADKNREGKVRYAMANSILLDERGDVGRAYGAKHTPTIVVIDAQGAVVFMGGVDNAPDGEPPGGQPYAGYADAALADVTAGRAVAVQEAPAYGCSVKY